MGHFNWTQWDIPSGWDRKRPEQKWQFHIINITEIRRYGWNVAEETEGFSGKDTAHAAYKHFYVVFFLGLKNLSEGSDAFPAKLAAQYTVTADSGKTYEILYSQRGLHYQMASFKITFRGWKNMEIVMAFQPIVCVSLLKAPLQLSNKLARLCYLRESESE